MSLKSDAVSRSGLGIAHSDLYLAFLWLSFWLSSAVWVLMVLICVGFCVWYLVLVVVIAMLFFSFLWLVVRLVFEGFFFR